MTDSEKVELRKAQQRIVKLVAKSKVLDALNKKIDKYLYLCVGPLCHPFGGRPFEVEMMEIDHKEKNAVEHSKLIVANLNRRYMIMERDGRLSGDNFISAILQDGIEKHVSFLHGLCLYCHAHKTAQEKEKIKLEQIEKRKRAEALIIKCSNERNTKKELASTILKIQSDLSNTMEDISSLSSTKKACLVSSAVGSL